MRPRASSSAFSACVMISPVDPESLVCVSAVYMYCSWVACLRVRPAPLSLHSARSGVGVGVGTASTTAKRSFDDDSPRMSQLKVLVDHAACRHCAGCRLRSNWRHGSRSSALSFATAIFTATRPRRARRSPSRRRSQRSTTAPSARASNQIGDRETRHAERSFCDTP